MAYEASKPREDWNEPKISNQPNYNPENKRIITGIMAILLGSLGVHKFILGYNQEGIILLGMTIIGYATICLLVGVFIVCIPGLIGLIEGIIYLTKTDEDFFQTYQVNKRPWF